MKTFIKTKHAIALLLIVTAGIPAVLLADSFTPAEKREINVDTPGLFEKSKSFSVDFTTLKESEYSFPLAGGKASASTRGLKISAAKGDKVKAMFGGTVRLARTLPSHGNVIVIRHNNGLETVYGGNSKNLVKVGEHVNAGQEIAVIGENGNGELYKHVYKFTKRGKLVDIDIEDEEAYNEIDENSPVDMEREFTDKEQSIVSAKTPELFEKSNTITINFAKYGENDWCYPLPGSKVISNYGGKRRHSGVDLKTKPNDSICAAFAGRVRFSKRYSGYGNVVVVRHASGLETLYSHNSKNLVKVGDWVKAGQVIALTGRTGRATTEHLHFEIRVNGRAYNPALIFDHPERALKKVKLVVNKSGRISVSKAK